jgi:hypothetical protein
VRRVGSTTEKPKGSGSELGRPAKKPGHARFVATTANMMSPPELIEYSIIVFEAVTEKRSEVKRIQNIRKYSKRFKK